jgi:hypothetical protein
MQPAISTQNKASVPPAPTRPVDDAHGDNQNFTTTKCCNRKKKNRTPEYAPGSRALPLTHINLTPQLYASIAVSTNMVAPVPKAQQPNSALKTSTVLPSITEVTIVCQGGHVNARLENQIRGRTADTIVCEVKLNMSKAVAHPIPLRASCWSIHPCSKGNFVFSFEGHIPFDTIVSYEHILLAPFWGLGQLCPSLGWTRMIAHGILFMDNDDITIGPDMLLMEVHTLPGLKKAFFAMEPISAKKSLYYKTILHSLSTIIRLID